MDKENIKRKIGKLVLRYMILLQPDMNMRRPHNMMQEYIGIGTGNSIYLVSSTRRYRDPIFIEEGFGEYIH